MPTRPTSKRLAAKKRTPHKNPPTRYRKPGGGPTEDGEYIAPQPPDGGPGAPPPPPGGEEPPSEDHGIPGLPPEVAQRLDAIIRQYGGGEPAVRRAMQWLMTTPWFKQEYAGYDVGFSKGMFGDVMSGGLARYRQYKSTIQGQWRQYYGRDVTQAEIVNFINQGYDEGQTARVGQGYTIAQANKGEWDYLSGAFGGGILTEEERKAYGEQQAGIETAFGQTVQNKVNAAMQRMQRVFQGTLGSSVLGDQALGQRTQRRPDIQA